MKDSLGNRVSGRTRWKRFAAVMLPALLAVGVLLGLMMQGALAASFAVSGSNFKVAASRLEGTGFAQYGGVACEVDGTCHPVAISHIREASLANLCQSVAVPTPLGRIVLRISAGGGNRPATASNLVVDVATLEGDAVFTNIEIGRDASTLNKAGSGATGPRGGFGQQADRIVVDDLRQVAWATTAGTFRLNGLALRLGPDQRECF